ncbi:hypothetical protein A3F07_04030 [candidate division WWE3 bacterium RIFCSPHIGHO2_12_FULL_38_15]|uniref:DUF5673 domain-containing protein n=1 Tax=candidate division WWE3 bacterium RIFCSPHIGHO2_02_FULL_38_14 TaxID=1802620 RepID=A0A1F4V9N4_UNCKA|nr:MAG: hypothetical protein A2793_04140 [candidate division WWE3 bacterium RIFCSPHIGHO2_01_FULL_38_45]OGC49304.1 MAG: hypothetical protein A3F07_04030 [candidate division WWE3 bacterium RIFCSPHIGHO2_12_FULL_38_15]OGC52713.1 MAG: hypothetical protein A3B64_00870 [candidate division WWE3 bacterium RIFCSPLOWO2_01_FULL_37_24]OGC53907.1 MAG: hypothetical protein A3D91_03925 [candidate division WWE3 bacterium RIFCSPHIGHO2_02_FULL_38_14]HLB51396.1 hypothetical protein [Patescibacteria group bacterium
MNLRDLATYVGVTPPKKDEAPVQPSTPVQATTPEMLGEKKVLYEWESSSKLEKRSWDPKMVRTGVVIGVVVGLLLFLMQEFFLILVVASVIFISYILSNSPMENVRHEISTHGVKSADQQFYWYELKQFFFTNTTDPQLLAMDTKDRLPGRLFFAFRPDEKEKLKELVSLYLPYLSEEPTTVINKAYYSLLDKFNFEGK